MLDKIKSWMQGFLTSPQRARPQTLKGERRRGADRRKQNYRPDLDTQDVPLDADQPSNDLVRRKYHREETGTHETLQIVDDSIIDSGEETGIDPYNTGNFDRSRNWDKRFRS